MKADRHVISELERLLKEYSVEVESARKKGLLSDKTANTYLLHPTNFVRWCRGDFVPGEKNLRIR